MMLHLLLIRYLLKKAPGLPDAVEMDGVKVDFKPFTESLEKWLAIGFLVSVPVGVLLAVVMRMFQ